MSSLAAENCNANIAPPLISVVLPVYNGERFVSAAIKSILSQTLRDFELIIINDGSTDGSLSILQKFERLDSRIRLVSRENKGLVATLNEGFALARGEWIARMDADDIAASNRLETQINWLKETGADVCGGAIRLFGTNVPRTRRFFKSNEAIKLQLLFGSALAHPTVIIRASIAMNNLYDRTKLYVEDYDLWSRLMTQGVKMTNCPNVVLLYRLHPGQTTVVWENQKNENVVQVSRKYAQSLLSSELVCDPGYKHISDARIAVDTIAFHNSVSFFEKLLDAYGDPENVISYNAYRFFIRCGNIKLPQILKASTKFRINLIDMMLLPILMLRYRIKNARAVH